MKGIVIIPLVVFFFGVLLVFPEKPRGADQQDELSLFRQRIITLEDRVSQLEKRIESLEGSHKDQGTEQERPSTYQGGWKNRHNWGGLKVGITEEQVRSILGEPAKIEVWVALVFWRYPSGSVNFDKDKGHLYGWEEPQNE